MRLENEPTSAIHLMASQIAISDDLWQDVDNTDITANKLHISFETLQRQ
jgi:hypothetical protein